MVEVGEANRVWEVTRVVEEVRMVGEVVAVILNDLLREMADELKKAVAEGG